MVQETAQMYKEEFKDLFYFFYQTSLEVIFLGWKPVLYTQLCNMSAQQKTLGFGGVCKVAHRFFHACRFHSKDIAAPNTGNMFCEDCREKYLSRPRWKCYCHQFASTSETEKYQNLLTELMNEHWVDLDVIKRDG